MGKMKHIIQWPAPILPPPRTLAESLRMSLGPTSLPYSFALHILFTVCISNCCIRNYLVIVHACVLSCFSHVLFFATQWAIDPQALLSLGFSRQEYWSGLPCSPSGDLPDSGIEPTSLMSPALAGRFFTASATWEAPVGDSD